MSKEYTLADFTDIFDTPQDGSATVAFVVYLSDIQTIPFHENGKI